MSQGVAKLIAYVSSYFPRQRFESEDQEALWIAGYVRNLAHYGDEILAIAADDIVRTRDKKRDGAFFPEPKVCIDACERAKRLVEARSMPLIETAKKPTEWSRERHELALAMMQSEMGSQATRESWHGALYDFCYANQRLPRAAEIDAVKRVANEFNRAKQACERGEVEWGAKPLAKLGANIVKRREKITALVNGGQNGNDA